MERRPAFHSSGLSRGWAWNGIDRAISQRNGRELGLVRPEQGFPGHIGTARLDDVVLGIDCGGGCCVVVEGVFAETIRKHIRVGDELLVDGGMVRFEVIEKIGLDVECRCTNPGLLLPRANLTFWRDGSLVRDRNTMLPTISSKDWLDIDFGIAEGVDFIAVSLVKSAEVIKYLKSYIK